MALFTVVVVSTFLIMKKIKLLFFVVVVASHKCFVGLVLLVRFRGVFGTFQLDFEPFGANLEAIHGLNGRLRAHRIVVRHETYNYIN